IRIQGEHPRIARAIDTHSRLQLFRRDAVEIDSGVIVIHRGIAITHRVRHVSNLCGIAALNHQDGSQSPATDQTIQQASVVEERSPGAEGKFVGAARVYDMTDVEKAWTVVQTEVAIGVIDVGILALNPVLRAEAE